jgi:Bacterial Ig-like domain (group 3).
MRRGWPWEQAATVDGSTVAFTPSGAATDQFGIMPVTIEITLGSEKLTPLLMIFDIQKSGYTNEEAVRSPEFETAMEAAVAAAIEEGGLGFSEEFKEAMLACFAHVAWADEEGQAYYDALYDALYPGPAPVTLVSITADYEQDRPIYDTDELDAIKAGDDLTVTANYSDGTSVVLGDDDYTLSGTLTAGTSTITAAYEGKTATFDVVVTAASILPSEYQQVEYIQSSRTQYIDTGVTPGGFPNNFNGYSVEITATVLTQQASGTAVLIGAGVQPGCWMGVVGAGVGLGTASGAYFTDIDTSIMQTYTLEWANSTLSAVCRDSTISRSMGSSVDNRPFTVFWRSTYELSRRFSRFLALRFPKTGRCSVIWCRAIGRLTMSSVCMTL